MLVYESNEQLLAESEPRRYLHTIILTALRDKAERLEIRFGEGEGMLYYRVEGRDWELLPPPERVYPFLKQEIRTVSRMVTPERPSVTVMAGVEGAHFEPLEVGWLTYQLGSYWADLVVRIDPREPYGWIRIEIDNAEDFADAAGEALSAFVSAAEDEAEEPDDTALDPTPT